MILVAALIVPSVASANPAGAWAAKFIGEYFLGKAIDELFDSVTGAPDLRELDSRLRTFETALVRVDDRSLNCAGSFRQRSLASRCRRS
jgi:hypothetical protein